MASQSFVHSIERDTAICSDRHSSEGLEDEQICTDQHLVSIDQRLYNASGALDGCRKDLFKFRGLLDRLQKRCTMFEQAYQEEKRRNRYASQNYQILYSQHETAIQDISELAAKNRYMQKDLDNARTDTLAQQSVVQEYEKRIAAQLSGAKKEEFELRIAELQKENTDLNDTLASAMSLVLGLEQNGEDKSINCAVEPQVESREQIPGEPFSTTSKRGIESGDEEISKQQRERTRRTRRKRAVIN